MTPFRVIQAWTETAYPLHTIVTVTAAGIEDPEADIILIEKSEGWSHFKSTYLYGRAYWQDQYWLVDGASHQGEQLWLKSASASVPIGVDDP
jgi:hypothetical protein